MDTADFRGKGPRANPFVKFLALLLSVCLGTGVFFGWVYCGLNWDTLFDQGDYTDSAAWGNAMNDACSRLNERLDYEWTILKNGPLDYLARQSYNSLLDKLDPENTNFRYTVRDNATGALLFSSNGENSLSGVTDVRATLRSYSVADGGRVKYDPERGVYVWYDKEDAELGVSETSSMVPDSVAALSAQWAVEYGVTDPLEVSFDAFAEAQATFSKGNIDVLYATVLATGLYLILTVFLLCCAGHRKGHAEFVLNWSDKIPYDLYLCAMGAALTFSVAGAVAAMNEAYFYQSSYEITFYAAAALLLLLSFALLAAALMSTASRVKTGTLLRNTLIWRLCHWIARLCREVWTTMKTALGHIDLTIRVILLFAGYLLLNAFLAWGLFLTSSTGLFLLCLVGVNTVALGLMCRYTIQWSKVRSGAAAIVSGAPETVIDTGAMAWFPALRDHAATLNDLGGAINTAVEERLKSERMKAELITNVSHDLKTPLTSIINYVDLLKKEDIQEDKAREYIEVLDRKSQRLKKLTEDLVEASKASTGAIQVNPERLGMGQLVSQALGEYTERFEAVGLTPILTLPGKEVYVQADGRHMWRVLDNLLGNCLKYALPGTRVYLDLMAWDGKMILSLKNVSAQQLNIPPDQLMERFVRGDESRTSEGSGLGLSIARSLTELQGGAFRLEVDGDLFKAVVTLPQID